MAQAVCLSQLFWSIEEKIFLKWLNVDASSMLNLVLKVSDFKRVNYETKLCVLVENNSSLCDRGEDSQCLNQMQIHFF